MAATRPHSAAERCGRSRRLRGGVETPGRQRPSRQVSAGIECRDLWGRRRLAAGRVHTRAAGVALWGGKGLRPPYGRRVSRAWPARGHLHLLQPRVAASASDLCDPQDHGCCGPHRRGRFGSHPAGKPRSPSRLGLGPGLRRSDGPSASQRERGRLRGRDWCQVYGCGVRRGCAPAGRAGPQRAGAVRATTPRLTTRRT